MEINLTYFAASLFRSLWPQQAAVKNIFDSSPEKTAYQAKLLENPGTAMTLESACCNCDSCLIDSCLTTEEKAFHYHVAKNSIQPSGRKLFGLEKSNNCAFPTACAAMSCGNERFAHSRIVVENMNPPASCFSCVFTVVIMVVAYLLSVRKYLPILP